MSDKGVGPVDTSKNIAPIKDQHHNVMGPDPVQINPTMPISKQHKATNKPATNNNNPEKTIPNIINPTDNTKGTVTPVSVASTKKQNGIHESTKKVIATPLAKIAAENTVAAASVKTTQSVKENIPINHSNANMIHFTSKAPVAHATSAQKASEKLPQMGENTNKISI